MQLGWLGWAWSDTFGLLGEVWCTALLLLHALGGMRKVGGSWKDIKVRGGGSHSYTNVIWAILTHVLASIQVEKYGSRGTSGHVR